MAQTALGQEISSGFILVNKPAGPTSHDIIARLRRITGQKKIGHAGTLDPFASGILVVAIGRKATREISQYVKMDKEYSATLKLGAVSDTYDREGRVVDQRAQAVDRKAIEQVLKKFIGQQKQIPPMFSAKKVKGRKLYDLARQGIEITRQPADIIIYSLEPFSFLWPWLKIKTKCSSGTYIRSLANDIGQALGCGAYLEALERTAVGNFEINEAVKLEDLGEKNWQEFLFSKK